MPRKSAGLLLYRRAQGAIEVLLVHPGGPLWQPRDEGAWTVPKGELDEGEEPLAAAMREFEEETGMRPEGPFRALTPVRLKSGKQVQAWAFEGDFDVGALRSNTFSMPWPPRSGKTQRFPEVDRAACFVLDEARRRINEGQRPLLDELERLLAAAPDP